jgi:hypothetical protein
MKRRKFLKNSFWGLTSLGILSGFYSWQIEPFRVELVKKRMPVLNLPQNLIKNSLVQISDIHIGNRFNYSYIIESFKEVQKLNPDFVVYTGDYVSYENKKQFKQLKEVLKHAVKGSKGTIAILGNHDYGKNWSQPEVANKITSILKDFGITVLRNEQEKINGLNFIGLDDYWSTNFKPENVMKMYDSSQANLLLCHNPDVCDLNVWNGYKGWILSGHTHGGQCKLPFFNPPILPVKNKKYSAGEIDLEDGRILYINRALGHSWQIRFNVRPEITLFEIDKA